MTEMKFVVHTGGLKSDCSLEEAKMLIRNLLDQAVIQPIVIIPYWTD